ncbi:MAG: hypothetical protein KA120_07690 [Candidatus Goldbacteria bacterium]|nr:hypothetical protein [Candidatus Goldiibacteriota bacterium]
MKYKYLFLIFVLFYAGCSSIPVSKENKILEFSIKPDKGIKPGMYVTAMVKTTDDVEKVNGWIDVVGSPKVTLKYNKEKKVWFYVIPIPVNVSLPKGEYVAKIEAITKSGEKSVAEKKVSTY